MVCFSVCCDICVWCDFVWCDNLVCYDLTAWRDFVWYDFCVWCDFVWRDFCVCGVTLDPKGASGIRRQRPGFLFPVSLPSPSPLLLFPLCSLTLQQTVLGDDAGVRRTQSPLDGQASSLQRAVSLGPPLRFGQPHISHGHSPQPDTPNSGPASPVSQTQSKRSRARCHSHQAPSRSYARLTQTDVFDCMSVGEILNCCVIKSIRD